MTCWKQILIGGAVLLSGCSSTPAPSKADKTPATSSAPESMSYSALPDKVYFSQKDPRWAGDRLGNTSDTMETDGCLVSATAMALGNLGHDIDPGELNTKLTQVDGYTSQGWLIWSAIDKVTNNTATARYYDEVSDEVINECIADGFYPLARFILPNGRSHWSVIIRWVSYARTASPIRTAPHLSARGGCV